MAPFGVESLAGPDFAVLTLSGELDLATVPVLHESALQLTQVTGESVLAVVDGTDLEFIDSTGIGLLVALWRRLASDGGQLIFVNVRPAIARTIQITGVDQVIPLVQLDGKPQRPWDDEGADAAHIRSSFEVPSPTCPHPKVNE
jgi:anti-sigma B factor antagonist